MKMKSKIKNNKLCREPCTDVDFVKPGLVVDSVLLAPTTLGNEAAVDVLNIASIVVVAVLVVVVAVVGGTI